MSLSHHIYSKCGFFLAFLIIGGIFGLNYLLGSEVKVTEEMLSTPKSGLLKSGNQYMLAGKTDSAMILFSTIVSYDNLDTDYKKLNNEDAKAIAQAYIHLGEIHHNLKSASSKYLSYAKAYKYYGRAVELGEKYKLKEELAKAYLGLGVLYSTMGYAYDDDALIDTITTLYHKSLEKAIEVRDGNIMDMAAKNLSVEQFFNKSLETQIGLLDNYFKRSQEVAPNVESSVMTRAFCHAIRSLSRGDSEQATAYADTMLLYSDNYPVHKIEAYSLLSDILNSRKDYKGALAMLDSAKMAADQVDDLWINLQILNGKSELLRELGAETKADSCLTEANRLRRKMLTDGAVGKVKDLHFTNQIDDLNSELTRLTIERKYTRRILAIVAIAFIIITAMLIIIWKAYSKLKETQRHIYMEYTRRLKEESDNKPEEKTIEERNIVEEDSNVDEEGKRYQGRQMSEEEKEVILQRIKTILSDADCIFQAKFQIKDLADKAGVSQRLISQVINDKLHCNFATLLAEYRIKEICRKISDSPSFRKLTVEAMAESGGFQSRSYFSTTFKKVTGLTPSAFIRQAELNDIKDGNN
ncbi:MAG: helix-turn-helix domain-containing protein [Muribaculaceae bacterium]|nr:helix-turn-helix domain-containing protein [Muribaculaceae bacterium]